MSPIRSQDSEIDTELLKPSLEESGNVGWDQRTFLFNKHCRNHFFIHKFGDIALKDQRLNHYVLWPLSYCTWNSVFLVMSHSVFSKSF